jgi:hypothetical protein
LLKAPWRLDTSRMLRESDAVPGVLYRVFVASPGDVAEERDRLERAVAHANAYVEIDGYRLDLWRYEDDADPGYHPDGPQPVIFEQMGEIDLFLGILWNRIGTRTVNAISGTVEEFQEAVRQWEESGRTRPRIMFYFKREAEDQPPAATPEDEAQLEKARAFKAHVEKLGLVTEFEDADEFERKVGPTLVRRSRTLHASLQAAEAGKQSPQQEAGVSGEDERDAVTEDLIGLRLSLERKLTWLCKHLLPRYGDGPFATIGSLEYDGYLSLEQARLASRILALDPGAISGRPEDTAEFRAAAEKVVRTFRAIVFDNHVQTHLPEGWKAERFAQTGGHREDFLATRDGRAVRVSARFALPADASLIERTVDRLHSPEDDPTALEDGTAVELVGRVVVVPDESSVSPRYEPDGVRVVKQEQLAELLWASARTPD